MAFPFPNVHKWTYLADLVELTGKVRAQADGSTGMPGLFDLEVDPNLLGLTGLVRGSLLIDTLGQDRVPKIHCETYPIEPDGVHVVTNRYVPWALPDSTVNTVTDPLAGQV